MDNKNNPSNSVEADVHITRKGRTFPEKSSLSEFDKSSDEYNNSDNSQIRLTSEKTKTVYTEKSKKKEFEKIWGNTK